MKIVASRSIATAAVGGGVNLRAKAMVESVWPCTCEYSAITEAFHAPPEAVTIP